MEDGKARAFWILPYPSGKPRKIQSVIPGTIWQPFSWMPDSRRIIVGGDLFTGGKLRLVDTESDTTRLLTAGSNDDVSPTVSPDGTKIAFESRTWQMDLLEIPLNGSSARSDLLATSRAEMSPAWSSVGNQYAYATDRNGSWEIWMSSPKEGWSRPLVTAKDFGNVPTLHMDTPSFSPDGQRIAYQRTEKSNLYAIWISPVSGGSPVRLINEDRSQDAPSWAPDGNWIAYLRPSDRSPSTTLAKARVGGSGPAITLKNTVYYHPKWSPKGDWITCLTTEGLSLISPDGKTSRFLTKTPLSPHGWSPDGSIIYGLHKTETENVVLKSIDIETLKETKLGNFERAYAYVGFSLAPDGKSFATTIWHRKGDIWLLEGFSQPTGFFPRLLQRLQN
jgi:Tol biopolymer transport system component